MKHPPRQAVAALAATLLALVLLLPAGCIRHQVEPIQVEPMHITVDVNLRVDRQLDNFFEFEDEIDPELDSEPEDPSHSPS